MKSILIIAIILLIVFEIASSSPISYGSIVNSNARNLFGLIRNERLQSAVNHIVK